jgi:hydroxymethylglutaryl-CoA lyase
MDWPDAVVLRDVSPRQGLGAVAAPVATTVKAALVDGLAQAGVVRVEVTGFVDAQRYPQFADAAELVARIPRRSHTTYSAWVLDAAGAEAAFALSLDEVTVGLGATETYQRALNAVGLAEALLALEGIIQAGRSRSVPVGVRLACAFSCPYEGYVAEATVMELAWRLYGIGVREITLDDTTGRAEPGSIQSRVRMLRTNLPGLLVGLSLRDTYGTALANMLAGLDAGVSHFDVALGGMGPGGGVLAIEDAVFLLRAMGVSTRIDFERVLTVGDALEREALVLPSRARRAHRTV